MTAMKVAQALERAKRERGSLPESITVDNGGEFCNRALEAWAMDNDVQLCFIRPGRPVESGFIESFNGRLRDEGLNMEWSTSLADAQQKLARFREDYNHQRPPRSIAALQREKLVHDGANPRQMSSECANRMKRGQRTSTCPNSLVPTGTGNRERFNRRKSHYPWTKDGAGQVLYLLLLPVSKLRFVPDRLCFASFMVLNDRAKNLHP